MPLAEIHGKTSRASRQSEDVLTGAVFNLLTLVPPRLALAPWLRGAKRLDGKGLSLPEPPKVETSFWKSFDLHGSTVEPDVLLVLQPESGAAAIVMIEVKYRSGLSGWPTGPEDDEIRGQLSRQWEVLGSLEARDLPGTPAVTESRALVYVTPETVLPDHDFTAARQELAAKGGDAEGFGRSAYWLSWFSLSEVVEKCIERDDLDALHHVALTRLAELLRQRRLAVFRGVPVPERPRIEWAYTPKPAAYPTAPRPVAVSWAYTSAEPRHA